MLGCFGGSKLEATAQALQAAEQTIAEQSQREAELNEQLAGSHKREQALQQLLDGQRNRHDELNLALQGSQAELDSIHKLNLQQAAQIHTLEGKCDELTTHNESLQGQLDVKRRQLKAYSTQVAELKSELVKKHKQQEHLKSKYQKMQEAMRMLEEVVVCVVGGQPEPPGPAGRRAPQHTRPDASSAAPGPDIVAKRFHQLRASANELRQSLAALSKDERRELSATAEDVAAARPDDDACTMPSADQALIVGE